MTMAMDLIRHIAGLYSGKAIKGDITQVFITGNEIWMAQQVLAEQAEGAQGERETQWHECTCPKIGEKWNPAKHGQDCPVHQARAALAQPSPAPALDFSKPLETEKGEPVEWICADVIEYKSARVCVAQDTGLVYSSPYIGLKIRNVVSAPELERPEAITIAYLQVDGWAKQAEREGHTAKAENYRRLAATINSARAKYDRIVGALRVTHQCTMGVGSGDGQLFVHGDHASIKAAQKIVLERDAAQARVAELEKQKEFGRVIVSMKGGYKCFEFDEYSHAHSFPEGEHQLYAAPVAQAGQVPEWIACTDRLPESGEPVIVWCSGSNQAGVAWIRQGAWLMPEPQALGYESITHWAPLPAAPQPAAKGDSSDE